MYGTGGVYWMGHPDYQPCIAALQMSAGNACFTANDLESVAQYVS